MQREMQTVPSRDWTLAVDYIFINNNSFTKHASSWTKGYEGKRKAIRFSYNLNSTQQLHYATHAVYHHHHAVPQARISLTLSHHFSLPFIASGRFSGLHPESSHSCCMYVWAGRPVFARLCEGIHRSTSLMSLSLLLQQWTPVLMLHLSTPYTEPKGSQPN